MEKSLLLVDDSADHIAVLENISNHLREKEGINLSTYYLNPNDRVFWDEEKDPDLDLLVQGVKKELSTILPSLIVVDYYYSGADFNGLNLIEKLRESSKFRKSPIFLISGRREAIVREIFAKEIKESRKVAELSKILKLRIEQFLDKSFKNEAIEVLKRISVSDSLPEKLREYEDKMVNLHLFSPRYRKLSVEELADMIDSDSDQAHEILNELFDLTLNHYINIDGKL